MLQTTFDETATVTGFATVVVTLETVLLAQKVAALLAVKVYCVVPAVTETT